MQFYGLDDQEDKQTSVSSEQQQAAPKSGVIPELKELEEYILALLDEVGVKS